MVESISSYGVSGNSYGEYVESDVSKAYLSYMQRIQAIMNKSSFTAQDINDLRELMRLINGLDLKESVLEYDKDLVFLFFKAAGIDPNNSDPVDPKKLLALKDVTLEMPPLYGQSSGKKIKLGEAIALALDPARAQEANRALGDTLLHFSTWVYDMYSKEVEKLQQQVVYTTQILNSLGDLLALLKNYKLKYQYPDNFQIDPTKWKSEADLPPGLRAALAKYKDKDGNGIPPGAIWKEEPEGSGNWKLEKTEDFGKLIEWVRNNKGTFVDICNNYFGKELEVVPGEIPPGTIIDLIKLRDKLAQQLKNLEEAGNDPTEEGSAAYALKKVLDKLKSHFSQDVYTDEDAKRLVEEFLMAGQGYQRTEDGKGWEKITTPGKNVVDLINDAISANQFLSAQLSDEIKAKNVFLNTVYEILTQAMKTEDKTKQGFARNIAR